jgi:hypothetical protein
MHLSLKYKRPGGFLSFAFLTSLELTKEIEVNTSVVSLGGKDVDSDLNK